MAPITAARAQTVSPVSRADLEAEKIDEAWFIAEVGTPLMRSDGACLSGQGKVGARQIRAPRAPPHPAETAGPASGDISEQAADMADGSSRRTWRLVDDLGISIREPGRPGVRVHTPMNRVFLFKGEASDTTSVHEILHHLSVRMPGRHAGRNPPRVAEAGDQRTGPRRRRPETSGASITSWQRLSATGEGGKRSILTSEYGRRPRLPLSERLRSSGEHRRETAADRFKAKEDLARRLRDARYQGRARFRNSLVTAYQAERTSTREPARVCQPSDMSVLSHLYAHRAGSIP